LQTKSIKLLLLEVIAVLVLLAVISLLLLHANPDTFKLIKPWQRAIGGDHVLHVAVGALLPLTLGVLSRAYRRSVRFQCAFFGVFPICYGIDEFVQSFTPHRESNWGDYRMSLLGWLIALLIWLLLKALRRRV
jgi:VanZ family protein